jgi:regulator of protease activity HflC (stomatin/prohibitin superfamily)
MRRGWVRRAATFALAVMALGLIVAVSGVKVARQNVGYVGVVRNGGPFDDRSIRGILQPGQRLTFIGMFSQAPHEYPASNVSRTYTVTADPKRGNRVGVDVVTVPTEDGVQVGVEATVFVRFVGESDPAALKQFDISFGSRKYPTPNGRLLYPWQGDDGFYAWMDALFRPVLDYDIRKEIGAFRCAELVASCALVSRGATDENVPLASSGVIASRISNALEEDLTDTLRTRYFFDIRMRVARISLPALVQDAVNETQAKYVAVNGAAAELSKARYESRRNKLLGRSYNESPSLATIDALKAIPKGSTVILTAGSKSGGSKQAQPSVLVGQ